MRAWLVEWSRRGRLAKSGHSIEHNSREINALPPAGLVRTCSASQSRGLTADDEIHLIEHCYTKNKGDRKGPAHGFGAPNEARQAFRNARVSAQRSSRTPKPRRTISRRPRRQSSARALTAPPADHPCARPREAFFRRHAAEMYDEVTGNCTLPLRVVELVYDAADRFPGLAADPQPDRRRACAEEADRQGRHGDRSGRCSSPTCSPTSAAACISSTPCSSRSAKPSSCLPNSGAPAGSTSAIRDRRAQGQLSASSRTAIRAFLNAEDDGAIGAMETGVDLVLLDDRIEVGVLRGGVAAASEIQGNAASSMPAST